MTFRVWLGNALRDQSPLLPALGQDHRPTTSHFEHHFLSFRYLEQSPGKFVGDTSCEKLPVEVCGAGCVVEDGPEECHDKQIDTLVDVPEEVCDLNPQKTCRLVTKLVPSLDPKEECTTVPKETCNLRFSQPSLERKPLRTEWCLDEEGETQAAPAAAIQPRRTTTTPRPEVFEFPDQEVEPVSAPDEYTGTLLQQLRRLRRRIAMRAGD